MLKWDCFKCNNITKFRKPLPVFLSVSTFSHNDFTMKKKERKLLPYFPCLCFFYVTYLASKITQIQVITPDSVELLLPYLKLFFFLVLPSENGNYLVCQTVGILHHKITATESCGVTGHQGFLSGLVI